MGVCERKVYLRSIHGDLRKSAERNAAINRGVAVHAKAELGNYKETKADSRCFIATCVYGSNAHETNLLREFRDKYLVVNFAGKAFVNLYYLTSPYIVVILNKSPRLRAGARVGLNGIVKILNRFFVR